MKKIKIIKCKCKFGGTFVFTKKGFVCQTCKRKKIFWYSEEVTEMKLPKILPIAAIFIFTACICINATSQHFYTKVNVTGKKNCYVTLKYKSGFETTWKVKKKDTLKIIHSTLLDSLCLHCDSIPDLKYKFPPREKNKTLRVLKRGEIHL